MIKNDYRRAFIMLRPAAQGFGGHARLERRTLTGSLYGIVTAPEAAAPLAAALVGRQDNAYYAAPLGMFSRDRRGQLTLASQFDPRAIDGRPLEAYWWLAVVETGNSCRMALIGNVDGSHEADPAALERAVCALYAQAEAPAADLPEPSEPGAAESDLLTGANLSAGTDLPAESDVKIYRSARSRAAEAIPANAEVAIPEPEPQPVVLPAPEEVLAETAQPADGEPQTAAQALGLDITCPWPAAAEALRRLFATQAPAETPLGGEFVYVAAAMPQGSGLGDCLVGLRAANGRITALRYALPGAYAPEPPAGLEGYAWVATEGSAGYWVLDMETEN